MIPKSNGTSEGSIHVYTLYLIRHGEAAHNVLEKKAQSLAREVAIAEGFAPDSDETRRRMEEARRSVLDDVSLLDSPLTKKGKEEALEAMKLVDELQEKGLPAPTEVLVSPLQRALQTTNLVFPNCDNIHVRLVLQERQTGKPCDTRQPVASIGSRKSFVRFSMRRLRLAEEGVRGLLAAVNLGPLSEEPFEDEDTDDEVQVLTDTQRGRTESVVEEKDMLRNRTKKVFDLLAESQHRVICVVTHKGYLRELERGHLGQPTATEFKNCEVRVYRGDDGLLILATGSDKLVPLSE